ncbi:MAG: 1-hydroxycarotenoid 3,4-desaturase CrtD [Wenzhouxiangella sp.]
MNESKPATAIVIGGGIGGLTAAVDLARRGLSVRLLESAQQPGGKMREVEIDGHYIDSGPTVFTMPWVFEQLFADAGTDIHEHLKLRPADLLARHFWRDGSRLDLFVDIERSAQAIAEFADAAEAERYRRFCRRAEQVFHTLDHPFMRSQRPSPLSLITASGLRGLPNLLKIQPFSSLWHSLGHAFRDHRLRSLFGRYATYCGASPLQATATLMLIAHVEQLGVWQVDGGMRRLADALAALFQRHGGEICYSSAVSEIEVRNKRAVGVRLLNGESLAADVIVANADVAGIGAGLLGPAAAAAVAKPKLHQRSLSAVTFSVLAQTKGVELTHHNVFFPDDYPQEFVDIFEQQRLPANPAVYICAQDRGPGRAYDGGLERLFMITNAPARGDLERFAPEQLARTEAATFGLLADCGLETNYRAEHCVITSPSDFERRFPGTGGAIYGAAPHGWRSSFTRPGARSRLRGLYLAGGSVHPGPGVPMVALSGRLAAAAAAADLGLRG